jgi:chromate reductase, NAD(P)H dehydrogenase (quinone)
MSSQSEVIRIVGISGSLRTGSFNIALWEALRERCLPGAEFTTVTLEQIPPFNEDLDREPALSAVANLRAAVAGADAVVIATPDYNHGIPGVLKNALDWASRPALVSCFRNKPVLILRSAPGPTGGVRAQYQLRETLTAMLAQVVTGRELVLGDVQSKMSDGAFWPRRALRSLGI